MATFPKYIGKRRVVLLVLVAILFACYYLFDFQHYLSIEFFKSYQSQIDAYYQTHPFLTLLLAALLYITVTSLSIPGTVFLTLCMGAIFGLFLGTLLVSFSSVIGATLAFLASRFLFRDWVRKHFGEILDVFNRGIERDGAFYLISLGLIPVFPYSVINLVMGVSSIRVTTFFWASQTGMLIETILIVNAGTQISRINSLNGLLSPELLASLTLLGLTPLLVRKILTHPKFLPFWGRPTKK
jgi:uncharacterized membrane protein YdjX (TVP38/TMEM64 family)